ncbi:metal ABC transporter ATP-binding protein [Neomegalonema sp.]|uniref:metal ABC transporter ATP-binding protein n=1 Tax=Neomegalonema sp. TaxID=2039713 RepID=UPI00261F86A9|nr:metal ABC transporter ATP-binding protein [Neomegalonema sp.]MDD2870038.1 metal ABC transporter ATP-binding protein [Neomegalonema sp.]
MNLASRQEDFALAARPDGPPASGPAPLEARGLSVSYGVKPALIGVDAAFPSGRMVAVIGPNGAGKSTFLKAALGLAPKIAGEVEIFGEPVDQAYGRFAYVPQRASVDWDFPTQALDVVSMGLYRELGLMGRFRGEHRRRAMAALERVGMADFADRQIGRLSGGQQQRVFLARALAQEADLYLLDEPFAGVDAATERAIVEVLKGLQAEGRTVVCVHHDLATAQEYFDYALLLNLRKIAEGPIREVLTIGNLQRTYGGRLTGPQLAAFGASGGASGGAFGGAGG